MGKWCLHASSFIFYRIIIKVAGNQYRHKRWDEFDFRPPVSMAHLYVFEMRFDHGTLDSGERSLPFGLLVYSYIIILISVCFHLHLFHCFLMFEIVLHVLLLLANLESPP